MAINAALAALAGGLTGTAQGLDVMQTGLEKEKQRRIDNEHRQMQADREESFRKMQIANMEAQRKLQQDTFNAGQTQQTRQNDLQDILSAAPGSVLNPDLVQRGKSTHLDYLMHQNPEIPAFLFGSGGLNQSQVVVPSPEQTIRVPTAQESRQRTLDDSTLTSQRLSQESAQASIDTSQANTKRINEARARIEAAQGDYHKVDPMDVILASGGHTIDQIYPQAAIDVKNATYHPPTIADYQGLDENGNPNSTLVPRVVGQNITGQPHPKTGAEKSQEALSKGIGSSIDRLEEISHEIITQRGLMQVLAGTVGATKASLAADDAYREYLALREGIAPAIAKQLAGRVNKQDMDAALNMLANPRVDSPESAAKLFIDVRNLLQIKPNQPQAQVPHAIDYSKGLLGGGKLDMTPQIIKGGF